MRAWLALAVVCVSGAASAAPEVQFRLEPDGSAPRLIATVTGAARPQAAAFEVLVDRGASRARALEVLDYARAGEPIAFAFVINGEELWMGNDDVETDDQARYPGVLKGLEHGLDQLDLASMVPAGSEVSIVTYATAAEYRLRAAPISTLRGSALGTQKDYSHHIGNSVVQGISLAIGGLERSLLPRKVLIVIGDGNDTNPEAAAAALAELAKRATQDGISTYAINYRSIVSEPGNVITKMIPGAVTANSVDSIEVQLREIATQLTDRFYVTFDATTLPWDGRDHELTLTVAGTSLAPATLMFPDRPSAIAWWRARWLEELALGVLLVGALIAVTRWRLRASAK